jgi:hypothetical protein
MDSGKAKEPLWKHGGAQMQRILRVTIILVGLGQTTGAITQPQNGLKLRDNGGINKATADLDYSLTPAQEISVRQKISVDDLGESDSDWKGDTESRYTFHYGDAGTGPSKIRPFVGAKADYVYGSKVDDSLMAGPEAGVKVHVQPDTLVVLKTGYQSLYRDVRQIDEALDDGSFTYRIGVDFRF